MLEKMKKISTRNVFGAEILQMTLQNNKEDAGVVVNNNTNNNSAGNVENNLELGNDHMNGCNENVCNDNEPDMGKDDASNGANCVDESQSVVTNSNSDKSFSVKDSTDNLSLLSDTDAVEEVLIIPDNISDEEISLNSDDCVYAYRGADYESPDLRHNMPDDETDFLEMDFEPDPASELDNTSDCKAYNPESNNDTIPSLPKLNFEIENSIDMKPLELSNPIAQFPIDDNQSVSPNAEVVSEEKENLVNGDVSCDNKNDNSKATGTKPKIITAKSTTNTATATPKSQKPAKYAGLDIISNGVSNGLNTPPILYNRRSEETCLDCLEKEFLSQSFGKNVGPIECRKCQFKITEFKDKPRNDSESYYEPAFDDCLEEDFINSLNKIDQRLSPCKFIDEDKFHDKIQAKNFSFSSIDVNEEVIAQALEKLNINFDKESLRKHFEAIENKTNFKDVTELILHTSKKNCDYKKTIKAIEKSCEEELELAYRPNNAATSAEVVRITSYDILRVWKRNNDLRKLKSLDKRFLEMNILGKVINVIRQAQQRNLTLGEYILIPQYYKTGSIYVARK